MCFFCFVPHISISIIHISSLGFYCGRRKNACQQLLPKCLNWGPEYDNAVQREKTGIRFLGHLTTEGYADLQVACEVLSLYPLVSETCFLISAKILLHWTRENNFVWNDVVLYQGMQNVISHLSGGLHWPLIPSLSLQGRSLIQQSKSSGMLWKSSEECFQYLSQVHNFRFWF